MAVRLPYRTQMDIDTAGGVTPHAIIQVFADGGMVGGNPSDLGGTYAYRVRFRLPKWTEWVLYKSANALVVADGGQVTNNITEMIAVLEGVEAALEITELPDRLQIYSDSWLTLQRLFLGASTTNLPTPVYMRMIGIRHVLKAMGKRVGYALLDGHPTRQHLADGVGKNGGPVHYLQHECDVACREIARQFKGAIKEKAKETG